MKKIAAIFILVMYLVPALGFSMTTHFCGGELASISFYNTTDNTCTCGNEMMSSDCCKNIIMHAEFSDSQDKAPTVTLDLLKAAKDLGVLHTFVFCFSYVLPEPVATIHPHPPDNKPDNPLYLRHQVFRI